MITTLHVPEFAKEIITTLLATSNHSLDDVVAMTNRPDDVACVERKFGAFIPADQLVTIYSTAGYTSIGMPADSGSRRCGYSNNTAGCRTCRCKKVCNILQAA